MQSGDKLYIVLDSWKPSGTPELQDAEVCHTTKRMVYFKNRAPAMNYAKSKNKVDLKAYAITPLEAWEKYIESKIEEEIEHRKKADACVMMQSYAQVLVSDLKEASDA